LNVKLIRGDTNRLNIYFRRKLLDADGKPIRGSDGEFTYSAINLTNATITLTARNTNTDVIVFQLTNTGGQIVVSNPANAGNAVVTVAPTTTASMSAPSWLDYDVELLESDSTKTTVLKGRLLVSKDITYA